jgi:hypothetical protein
MEIILHIGLHKTGTTSIQETLWDKENEAHLASEGISYPHSEEDQ